MATQGMLEKYGGRGEKRREEERRGREGKWESGRKVGREGGRVKEREREDD